MVKPRIIVQSDWQEVLKEKGSKAWIAFKQPGDKTVYSELKQTVSGVSSTDGFSVDQHTTVSELTVSYRDVCRSRFHCPTRTFSQVHSPRRSVLSIDVTPGGLAVTSNSEGQLFIWTTENGEVRRHLSGHHGDVYCCRFFPSGVVVLSGGADTLVKIWSAETGRCAATLSGHAAGVTGLSIVERGRNVVSCSRDGSARLWDCSKSTCVTTFAPVSGGIINGCCTGQTSTDVSLGSPDHTPDEGEVLTEGKMLLVACESGFLEAFGLHSRKQIFSVNVESAVNCCCLLSNTLAVCGTQNSTILLFDLRNVTRPLLTLDESRSAILSLLPVKQTCFATSGDGSCFTVTGYNAVNSFLSVGSSMEACSAETLSSYLELTGPDCDPVYDSASDGRFIYTVCRDSNIRTYRLDALF